uniref:Uncharacterized protein n=1 Tax=Loa loa TaxID=7209 RepID=A0A1I7VLJ1_LOALO
MDRFRTDEPPIPAKMPPEVMPKFSPKKDVDELPPVKVIEIYHREKRRLHKVKKGLSEQSKRQVPQSMPIIDVQHDKTRNDNITKNTRTPRYSFPLRSPHRWRLVGFVGRRVVTVLDRYSRLAFFRKPASGTIAVFSFLMMIPIFLYSVGGYPMLHKEQFKGMQKKNVGGGL